MNSVDCKICHLTLSDKRSLRGHMKTVSQPDKDSTKTPEKQLPSLSNNFSDEEETPPLSNCYAPSKKVIKLSRL